LTRTDFENSPYRWREEKRERERSDSTGIDWERDPGINREREREREREVIRLGLTERETLDWDLLGERHWEMEKDILLLQRVSERYSTS